MSAGTRDEVLLTVDDLAARYQVTAATIYQWRYKGVGPVGIKEGKHVRYRLAQVLEWEERNADSSRPAA
jgi:predicted DNA-binding transcriptional regulator AlpA